MDVQSAEHLAEDVGHREVLEDPAADFFRQQPELRHYFGLEIQEMFVATALAEPFDQTVEVTLVSVRKQQLHSHVLTKNAVEADFPLQFSHQIDPKTEKPRGGFATLETGQQDDIFAKWRGELERSAILGVVGRHANSLPAGHFSFESPPAATTCVVGGKISAGQLFFVKAGALVQ